MSSPDNTCTMPQLPPGPLAELLPNGTTARRPPGKLVQLVAQTIHESPQRPLRVPYVYQALHSQHCATGQCLPYSVRSKRSCGTRNMSSPDDTCTVPQLPAAPLAKLLPAGIPVCRPPGKLVQLVAQTIHESPQAALRVPHVYQVLQPHESHMPKETQSRPVQEGVFGESLAAALEP
ncbi:hypothetical protein V5799_028442 [Amblyomma americanum]|uniref:Uncharacterized protein n=1 Tax=Amblyomma americanum TaxID=6943 RepID=A0AAQ4DCV1_AMBAM